MSVLQISPSPENSRSINHKKFVTSSNSKQRLVSYEDVLIGKYLEEIQQHEVKQTSKGNKKLEIESPYLQKLSHSNLLQTIAASNRTGSTTNLSSNRSQRPNSRNNSVIVSRPGSGVISNFEKFEPYYEHEHNKQNANNKLYSNKGFNCSETNFDSLHLSLKGLRPSSAPVRRPGSMQSLRMNSTRSKKNYKRQPNLIRAVAFRNGSRQISAQIAARNIAEFLQIATDRLQFNRAARRIFLENGDEIKNESQFLKNTIVYVSCGEEFNDPFLNTKKLIDKKKSVVWTSDGVQFLNTEVQNSQDYSEPINDSKSNFFDNYGNFHKPLKNDRLTRNTRLTKRLVAYPNGAEHSPALVVFEYLNQALRENMTENEIEKSENGFLEDFLEECTNRVNLSGIARFAYNWDGQLVKSLADVPKLDKCLQSLVNEVEYAPVWISKGEGFDARGALFFVENLIRFTKNNRKELYQKRNKLNKCYESLKKEIPQTKVIAIRILEVNESLKVVNNDIEEINLSISNLESVLSSLQSQLQQQNNNGYDSLFKHIKSIDTNERIFGGLASKGLKLKVSINGTEDSFDVFFNLKDWSDNKENQKSAFHQLLSEISRVYNRNNSTLIKFTRLFNESGEEIKIVNKIRSNDIVWVSQGENWKGQKEPTMAVSISLKSLFAMRSQNEMSTLDTYQSYDQAQEDQETAETLNETKDSIEDENEDLKNFFKNKSFASQKPFTRAPNKTVPKESYNLESYNFKTYIEPLKYHELKKLDKPEFWDVFNERESIEKLNEASIDYNPIAIKDEVAEIQLKNATQILIQCKNDESILLNPKLQVNLKSKRTSTKTDSIWFHDFQTWKFNKAGYIYNQFFPKICLTLNTSVSIKLEIHLKKQNPSTKKNLPKSNIWQETETIVKKGYAICLGTRELSDKNDYRDKDQQWHFNKFGNIYSKALNDKQMVFTSTDYLLKELNNLSQNGILEKYELQISESNDEAFKELNSSEIGIFLLESFDNQLTDVLGNSQRWAIKQENARSIGEWRFSELSTSLWHKLGLTWPVNEKEQLIENFRWPITGYLIPGAPPLKQIEESTGNQGTRLKVIKNGSIDFSSAITLSRMSVKSIMKEFIHCSKISYRQFEFNTFLDTCTNALGLPNAARRLFDSEGVEHFELTNLKQDEIIFVSMGEPWIHPKIVREEQERKIILTNLTEDLNKICFYSKLKQCQNFVVETSNMSMQEGARLVIGPCCLSFNQIERIKKGESIQNVIEIESKEEESVEDLKPKKAHQISHENIDALYAKKFRWPWEVIVNKSMEGVFEKKNSDSDNEEGVNKENDLKDSLGNSKSYDQEMSERFKPKPKKSLKNLKLSSQKFGYNKAQGFIYSIDNPSLVFGLYESDNNQSDVFLFKKNEDSISQRWIYRPDGVLISKARPSLVLTVKLPPIENTDIDINDFDIYKKSVIKENVLTVQPLVDFENGNANQKWFFDESIGFLYAFATSEEKNIEITAANKAGICTYYITYDNEYSQPGYYYEYQISTPSQDSKQTPRYEKVLICSSCAKSTRGKFKLTKLTKNQNFACFMGKSKDKSLKQYDGFKYLHDKVDLNSTECENSLIKWHDKLIAWRHETNAKSVLNELSASKNIDIIRLYAYKNGEGRRKAGESLVGSSIQGLLDQATNRLQLTNAARRLYTEDGTLILDAQDLITWAIEYYRKELYKVDTTKQEKNVNKKVPEKDVSNANGKAPSLLDKVNFSEAPNSEKTFSIDELTDIEPLKSTKPFAGPTKSEIKRLLNEYDRTSKIDAKKLLRWPIEIWVSCGEQFVPPKLIYKLENHKMMQREQLDRVEHELEIQAHTLRQMTGRRLTSMSTGQYKSIKNPDIPVIREGHWTEVTYEEQIKQAEVNQLKNYVDEIKNPNKKPEKTDKSVSKGPISLYTNHSVTKRVLVYVNGESPEKAQYCWAASIDELNENAKIKLRLTRPIKFFFTQDGKIISRFEDIIRDQLVCVSTGREFIPPEMRNRDIELKANWHRIKKEEGFEATNIKVNSKRNPIIDVDPFGPPLLTTSKQPPLALPPPPPEKSANKDTKKKPEIIPRTEKPEKTEKITNRDSSEEVVIRPQTAKPSHSRKPKKKSKSPKRVHIANDVKDISILQNSISVDNFQESKESINEIEFNEDSDNEDVMHILN